MYNMKTKLKSSIKRHLIRFRFPYAMYLRCQRLQHPSLFARTDEFWRAARGVHRGKPGFVVGNGPSLRLEDLDAISDQICIASNKIYLAFEKVKWRPAYYSCSDWLVWDKIRGEVPKHFQSPLLLSTFKVSEFPDGAILMKNLGFFMSGRSGFSFDCEKGQFGGYTVTFNNLQTAVHLGLNPIYLIGCDHYYSGEEKAQTGGIVAHSGASNHFLPNYRSPGEVVNMAPIEMMNAAYRCAKAACDSAGIQVYNATRGGHLEIFPRISLDEVIASLVRR